METINKTEYEEHSFKSFLKQYQVVIPMVQRDYAQGRTTDDVKRVRSRFLDAIYDHLAAGNQMKMDFVYGEKEKIWIEKDDLRPDYIVTPLDGQQRLTTLYLLHWFAARKANIEEKEYSFLSRFTYAIRPSSRDFCTRLIEFKPASGKISRQITDQHWFMAEWNNDPTILGMLVMLDAIKEKFDAIDDLWIKLTEEELIKFYFLSLNENGLSDELYIKMNSRGKKLTAFEHFKAEFEALYERDLDESNRVNHKFDVEWIDVLFPYRDESDNTVDREFMRYFFYISHILCYKQGIKKSNDEFELIKLLYDGNCKDRVPNINANDNRAFLEKALDCWYVVSKNEGIDGFFKKYLSSGSYEQGKVATYKTSKEYRGCQNYFTACIKLYQVNNSFSYGDFLFLYGIVTYLINKDKVLESDFVDRIRVLRNLIMNSNAGEIRGDADYMRDQIDEVETLMLQGTIKTGLAHGFNGFQEREEQDKQLNKNTMSQADIERMHRFEDHPLIYGFVSGLGYANLHLVDTFYELFSGSNYCTIHRAMISIDDYRQYDNNRYYMGNYNGSTWATLLHKSLSRKGFEKTMEVLVQLLERLNKGETLEDIINKYLDDRIRATSFSWRYYFAKYADMVRGADGEFVWGDSDYSIKTLNKHQFNGQNWDAFLNVIYKRIFNKYKLINDKIVVFGNYGDNLGIFNPRSSLSSSPQGFVYYYDMNHDNWTVPQDAGVDTEDRVEMACAKIVKIINENNSNLCATSTT